MHEDDGGVQNCYESARRQWKVRHRVVALESEPVEGEKERFEKRKSGSQVGSELENVTEPKSL